MNNSFFRVFRFPVAAKAFPEPMFRGFFACVGLFFKFDQSFVLKVDVLHTKFILLLYSRIHEGLSTSHFLFLALQYGLYNGR